MDEKTYKEIEKLLMQHYDLEQGNANGGCYIGNKWLSVEVVLSLIKENLVY